MEDNIEKEGKAVKSKPLKKWFYRFIIGLVVLFVLINLAMFIVLKNQKVQNYLVDIATEEISKNIGQPVQIDEINFTSFFEPYIKGIYIADNKGDTLFTCDKIYFSINSSVFELINSEIKITEITIDNPYFRIIRDRNRITNMKYNVENPKDTIDIVVTKEISTKKSIIDLNINKIYINNLLGFYSDTINQSEFDIKLTNAYFTTKDWNVECKEYYFDALRFNKLEVLNTKFHEFVDFETKDYIEPIFDPNIIRELTQELHVATDRLEILNSTFILNKRRKIPNLVTEGAIDFDHMNLQNINLTTEKVSFLNRIITIDSINIDLNETTGFKVKKMSSSRTTIAPTKMDFKDLEVESDFSHIYGGFTMKYLDFSDFEDYNNNVIMKGFLVNSNVAIDDLFYFSMPLHDNRFFIKNRRLQTNINGKFRGKVNSLKVSDMTLSIADKLNLKGSFRSRDITDKGEMSLDMKVSELNTSIYTLKSIIPNFNVPKNFNKFGNIFFKGRFLGFLHDFVSSGHLESNMGVADIDIRFHSKNNKFDNYDGKLNVTNFNLREWASNEKFGYLNFDAQVKNGTGFTLETVNAEIDGSINSLEFNNYNYKKAYIVGTINKNLFNGSFKIRDKNVNFDFDGNINIQNEIPRFKFNSTVYDLNLYKLNLYPKDLMIKGKLDMDLTHIDIDKALGEINITDLILEGDNKKIYLDSIKLYSGINNGQHVMKADSKIGNFSLIGEYRPKAVLNEIKKYFKNNQSYLYTRLYNAPIDSIQAFSNYTYIFKFGKINPVLEVLGYDNYRVSEGEIRGDFNSNKENYKVKMSFPYIRIDSTKIYNFLAFSNGIDDKLNMTVELDSMFLNNKLIPKTTLVTNFNQDLIDINLNSKDLKTGSEYLNISLSSLPLGNDRFKVNLKDSLYVLGDLWEISENNSIFLSHDSIAFSNLSLINKSNIEFKINDINNGKGVKINVDSVDMNLIDRFWDYPKLDFEGKGMLDVSIGNVFTKSDFKLRLESEDFYINNDNWGKLLLRSKTNNLKDFVLSNLSLANENQSLILDGKYYTPLTVNKPDILNFNHAVSQKLDLNNIPLNILEYFIQSGISNTKGVLNGYINFKGDISKLDIEGKAVLTNGATKVDYLNIEYFFHNDTVLIDNTTVDASGAIFKDKFGNEATIAGGLIHNHLKGFELDVMATSEEFLVLNTNVTLNPLYYGTVVGDISASFKGPFQKTDIIINGETGKNTVLNIPINIDSDAGDLDYIVFVDPKQDIEQEFDLESSGISVVLSLKITEDALGRIIFDEDAGDVIQGYGKGDIKLDILRGEPFLMQGKYTFTRGEYVFTLTDFIHKNFTVKAGSSIQWDGDPLAGRMKIEADYKIESAKVYNLIVENLDPELKAQASLKTPVFLKLYLSEELLKPSIDFDVKIPELTGTIKNLVDSKLSRIRSNKAELNRQVLGLIVVNSFLPSVSNGNSATVVDYTLTTDLVTNEISNYVSDLLGKAIEDINFISNIDFNLGYTAANRLGNDYLNPYNTFDLDIPIYLYDDRISITVGSSIGFSQDRQSSNSNFFNGDVEIEYAITSSRQIRVRVLTKKFNDYIFSGRNIKYGAGLRYYREFDTLSEIFKKTK